jgi:transposase
MPVNIPQDAMECSMNDERLVTVGVDTHTDVHVAAVLDQAGRLLGTASLPATTRGYARLATWAESFGQVDKVGMEGAVAR